jgi:chemotaxis family two-component system response regulator Rcp1
MSYGLARRVLVKRRGENCLKIVKFVKMLVVEDSPSDVRLLREALRDSSVNVQIQWASDLTDAWTHLNQCKQEGGPYPDLIILDLNLPGANGRELLQQIKSDPELRKLPVIIMTSSADEEDIEAAYRLNANCFVRKPRDLYEYEKVVRGLEEFWFSTVTLPRESYRIPGNAAGHSRSRNALARAKAAPELQS